jgi:hypothetical protein
MSKLSKYCEDFDNKEIGCWVMEVCAIKLYGILSTKSLSQTQMNCLIDELDHLFKKQLPSTAISVDWLHVIMLLCERMTTGE